MAKSVDHVGESRRRSSASLGVRMVCPTGAVPPAQAGPVRVLVPRRGRRYRWRQGRGRRGEGANPVRPQLTCLFMTLSRPTFALGARMERGGEQSLSNRCPNASGELLQAASALTGRFAGSWPATATILCGGMAVTSCSRRAIRRRLGSWRGTRVPPVKDSGRSRWVPGCLPAQCRVPHRKLGPKP